MPTINRRDVVQGAGAALLTLLANPHLAKAAGPTLSFGQPFEFGYEALVDRARDMAAAPYSAAPIVAPDVIEAIDYDAHGKLRYRPDEAVFADGSGTYPATFFHVGRYFPRGVKVHTLQDGFARVVRYSPELFDMPADSVAKQLSGDVGFAGFRFQEARSRDDWKTQDWLAFLGASYWRAIGDLGQYGLSARGVAIDSATPGPEEFPEFREFYLTPAKDKNDPNVILALLDGPGITGAYKIAARRGKGVVMEVEARLFLRRDIERLGIAPLVSMYWYSETNADISSDWRPEIHDSDGLAIWTGGGERIWRPLTNPRFPNVSSFLDENPKGFGLMQRDRNFEHYLDGVYYDRRPSLWIEPLGDWGRGSVQLMELRTDDEIHDNIGAFWVPEGPARAGNSYTFKYRQYWQTDMPTPPRPTAICVSTRIGHGGRPGQNRAVDARKFVVEFDGSALAALKDGDEPEAVVASSTGRVDDVFAEKVPGTKKWRIVFDLYPAAPEPAELRAFLRTDAGALTETWLYRYDPLPR
ncbi:glucan biosynthesis protein D [Thalassobaculum sp. OXR-137]|uniref:glucan biosynthesis protein n=1 Tax=Thalassobaculum sp. OXR-137 TaxID=3100173 RepID=UPI002AC92D2B|nr:glucan biosynthesis protein D [Thalassobaculum sp. OXR-137]WPZ34463.1 glucan biosynthesis protein D [Thalassobaculum sp. OXR-137]